jgi:hypothetical protein
VVNSQPAAIERRGCVGRPVRDDSGPGCNSVAQAVFGSRVHVTGLVAPAVPNSAAWWLRWHLTRWPGGIQHKGLRDTSGPGCDSVAQAAFGSSAYMAVAVLEEVSSVVSMAPRHRGS